jgi:hypothetical protein
MEQSITVTLPAEVGQALEELTQREGIPAAEVVARAVKEHLFLRQFRLLRQRMSPQARSQGVVTDQDVFDRVS